MRRRAQISSRTMRRCALASASLRWCIDGFTFTSRSGCTCAYNKAWRLELYFPS